MRLFPKLAFSMSGLLAGSMAALSFSIYVAEERHIRDESRLEQQAVLENLVHIAGESFLTNDDLLLVKYVRWLRQWTPVMMSASVVDVHGAILAHSEPERIGQQHAAAAAVPASLVVLTAPIRLGSSWKANASIAFSRLLVEGRIQSRLHELQTRLVDVTLWSLLLGLVVSFFVALSWTHPVKRLARRAEEIGAGRWGMAPNSLDDRKDELGGLARAFTAMSRQLQQLDLMKEDFVSSVTHELRSPLGAIESYLNVIAQERDQGISAAAWTSYLDRLRINTQRLTHFVNDLLDVAALERGVIRLDPEPIDMTGIAQDVLGLFALKLKEKNLAYEVTGPENLEYACGDAEKIRQVLVNLVSNAIKFTPAGGRITIRVATLAAQKIQRISVKDNGPGISAEERSQIFNKFEQVSSAKSHVQGPKGTGLGLSISKALVELHGQTLQLKSEIGKGSTFFFALPLAEPR